MAFAYIIFNPQSTPIEIISIILIISENCDFKRIRNVYKVTANNC